MKYLVFIKADYVRDAQAMTGGTVDWDADNADDQAELAYRDCSGPMLILETDNKEDIIPKLQMFYPNASLDVFQIFDATTQTYIHNIEKEWN